MGESVFGTRWSGEHLGTVTEPSASRPAHVPVTTVMAAVLNARRRRGPEPGGRPCFALPE